MFSTIRKNMTRPISLEIYDAFKKCDAQWMQRRRKLDTSSVFHTITKCCRAGAVAGEQDALALAALDDGVQLGVNLGLGRVVPDEKAAVHFPLGISVLAR